MAYNADKKDNAAVKEMEPAQRLREYEERLQSFQSAIGILLFFIKGFSLDLQEIDADSFKNEIDALDQEIRYENDIKKLMKRKLIAEFPFMLYRTH